MTTTTTTTRRRGLSRLALGAGGAALALTAGLSAVPANAADTGNATLEAIKECESGGDYTAVNASSGASGAYQFLDSTWQSLSASAGYTTASSAPESVQDAAALELFAAQGSTPWAASESCWSGAVDSSEATDSADSAEATDASDDSAVDSSTTTAAAETTTTTEETTAADTSVTVQEVQAEAQAPADPADLPTGLLGAAPAGAPAQLAESAPAPGQPGQATQPVQAGQQGQAGQQAQAPIDPAVAPAMAGTAAGC